MRSFARSLAVAGTVVLVWGCNKTEEVAKDSVADVFKGDAPEPEVAQTTTAHIGTLPVLDGLSPEGTCAVQHFSGITAAMSAEYTFRERFPNREITLGVGQLSREFRPVNIDVRVTRDGPNGQEHEALVASFSEDGRVTAGQRQFFTADNSIRERRDLVPDDGGGILNLARALYDRCQPQR